MSHRRTEIRTAIKNLLLNQTPAGTRVFTSRIAPMSSDDFPYILIYSLNEESRRSTNNRYPLRRTLTLAVEARVQGHDNIDDELDNIAVQIETLLGNDDTFGLDDVQESNLITTETDYSAEGNKPIGAIRLTFEVKYIF